jgi:DNA-binding IclR family transcriptional regulator
MPTTRSPVSSRNTAAPEKIAQATPRAPRRVRPVPAVSRSIAILRLLGRSPEPLGVKAIAQTLGMVTSTCLHILRVLVTEELVRVDGTKRYSLGVGMLSLARSVLEGNRFPAVVQPALDRIATQWGVTAIGVETSGLDHMVVLALSRSRLPFRLHVDVGSRFPGLISATGRLVAAFSDQPWSEIARRFRSLRWQNAPDIEEWRKEIEAVRRKGYSVDRGNYIHGVTVLSVPVLDARNQVAHALVAAGLADQMQSSRVVALAQDMRAEADRLSALLFSKG